mmetsp:Transcript_23869/g.35018  ORF Transcript_23869/g.35018 Transcript_23869/m.35018 type:complete len:430 (+) Transcript_23869:74-1363(+)
MSDMPLEIATSEDIDQHIYSKKYWTFVNVATGICVVRVCSNAVSLYNTAVLGSCGGIGQSVQYLSTGLFSLFLAKPTVDSLGCKNVFLVCGIMYVVYVLCFLGAVLCPKYMWEFNIPGSALNGIAESLWLIGQGIYYSTSVTRILNLCPTLDDNTVRSQLAATHSTIYMGADTSLLIIITFAINFVGNVYSFSGILILCIVSTIYMLSFSDLDDGGRGHMNVHHLVEDVGQTFNLLRYDSRIKLVTPFLLAYGACNATVGTYITGVTIATSPQLGEAYVGILSALSRLAGTSCGPIYDFISVRLGKGRHWVMLWGCAVYAICGGLILTLSTATLGVPFVAVLYQILWGTGRGVMENTCRLIFAEFFAADVSSAFSFYAFAVSIWTGVSYFIDDVVSYDSMGTTVLLLSVCAAVCYHMAYSSRWEYSYIK